MPIKNNFQHANYSRADPGDRVVYRDFLPGAAPGSQTWKEAIAHLGRQLSCEGVRAIVFVQGSPLSTDLFGAQRLDEGMLKRGYSRGIPGLDTLLGLMREKASSLPAFPGGKTPPFSDDEDTKRILDRQIHDTANVPTSSVERLGQALNGDAERPIVCQRYLWSSEHHHVGRAKAAFEIADHVRRLRAELGVTPKDRLLVIGHGHAGHLLALLSNLMLPGANSARTSIVDILRTQDAPRLDLTAIAAALESGSFFNGAVLDVVTMGTPVRYGWETSAIGKLLHIVNHRPMRGDGKQWLAKMELPQITVELPYAMGGDYVQQLAVAGTDAVPGSAQTQAANKALWELLEPYDGFERWLECARKGVRCQNDGTCLLVDYKDADTTPEATPSRHLFGHAVYTREHALLFNLTQIVQSLYSS
jgi:hypothetical protein